MTKTTDVFNRSFNFLVGLILLLAGTLTVALYFDVPFAQRLINSMHPRKWDTVPSSPWFLFTVGTLGVFALALGIVGIVANLGRSRVSRIERSASTTLGSISFSIDEVADAAAQTFTTLPKVIRSRAVVFMDRGHRVMSISVDSESSACLAQLTEHAAAVEQDIRDAIRDTEVEIVFKFHMAPVERLTH